MQKFNTAELRPVERARAYLQKKMLEKPLREDAGADVLRDRLGTTIVGGSAAGDCGTRCSKVEQPSKRNYANCGRS